MGNETSNPLVSIVMATYSGDDITHLKLAVDSILNQSYQNIEFIIVVDGSINKIQDAYISELANHGVVQVLKNHNNMGPAFSRNMGISAAHGSYIAIMDADDISTPDRLSHQLNYILVNNLDLISSYLVVIDEHCLPYGYREVPISPDSVRKFAPFRCPLHNPSAFGKSIVFKRLFYSPNLRVSEDYDLWIRALIQGYKLGNTKHLCVLYRQSRADISKRIGLKYALSDLNVKYRASVLCSFYVRPIVIVAAIFAGLVRLLPKAFFKLFYRFRMHDFHQTLK
jgi:glycosyltransferase involved in cell wall biosynthesis